MKILLIILVITLAIKIISKRVFMSKFTYDIFGTERLKYQLENKMSFSEVIYSMATIAIFIELIIIAIKLIFIIF